MNEQEIEILKYLPKCGFNEDKIYHLEQVLKTKLPEQYRLFLSIFGDTLWNSSMENKGIELRIVIDKNINIGNSISCEDEEALGYLYGFHDYNLLLISVEDAKLGLQEKYNDYHDAGFLRFATAGFSNSSFSIQLSKNKDYGSIYLFDFDMGGKYKIAENFIDFLNLFRPRHFHYNLEQNRNYYEDISWDIFERKLKAN